MSLHRPLSPSLPPSLPFPHLSALATEPKDVFLRQVYLSAWPRLLDRQELIDQPVDNLGFNGGNARAGGGGCADGGEGEGEGGLHAGE